MRAVANRLRIGYESVTISYDRFRPMLFPCRSHAVPHQVGTIIQYGRVLRPAIGISYMQGAQARALGVSRGVLVMGVSEGSGASNAGIRGSFRKKDGSVSLGDVIVGVDTKKVENDSDLFRALDQFEPGQSVRITLRRLVEDGALGTLSDEELTVVVKLQATEAKQPEI